MMLTKNYKLFSIQISHSYFIEGVCPELTYSISPETQIILKKFPLLIHYTNTGLDFFTQTSQTNEQFLNYIEKVISLDFFEFIINIKNERFYNITAFPTDKIFEISYSSSKVKELNVLEEQELAADYIEMPSAKCLGTIKIYFKDLLLLNKPIGYKINFEAKSSQWDYYIIDTHKKYDNLKIVDASSDNLTFTTPKKTVLQNGVEALLISSIKDKLLICEVPKYSFNLVNTFSKLGATRTKNIFEKLPSASPNNYKIVEQNHSKKIVSNMYVYV